MKSGIHESDNILLKIYHWIKIRKYKYCKSFCPTCEFWQICQADTIIKNKIGEKNVQSKNANGDI